MKSFASSVSPHESPRIRKVESSLSIHSGNTKNIPDAVTLSAVTNICSCNQPKDANTSGNNANDSNNGGGSVAVGAGLVQKKGIVQLDSDIEKYQLSNVSGEGSHGRCPKLNEIK